jgi:peptide/nickel transport system ATP-binding protein/oligopeptide transport system ATP-binding protein
MEYSQNGKSVLKVSGLKTHFFTTEGTIRAVDGVDFQVKQGEVLGLVGESGCGKSVSALSILRLVPNPPGQIVAGEIEFMGKSLLKLNEGEIRKVRGKQISMIFQDPLTSLNPVLTIGYQLAEVFRFHKSLNRIKSLKESIDMLKATEIPSTEERVKQYPHQMSGGMRQRVMIAMSLACEPALLIADEPTTALDVTVQAQVLKLMKKLCRERQTAVILITHDMGVVANMCQRVAVMYAGRVVEYTDVFALFNSPAHPYTEGLLRSLPIVGRKQNKLDTIEGQPPMLNRLPPGCAFTRRCKYAKDKCKSVPPELVSIGKGHEVRCYFPILGERK